MNLDFENYWIFLLLPAATLPLLGSSQSRLSYSWVGLLPIDRLSIAFDWLMRCLAALAIATLITGIAAPFLREQTIMRIGKGAQIVLLIDRSASMNANFAGSFMGGGANQTKRALAHKLLGEFVKRRPEDLFAMISFSTAPIYVLPLTQDRQAILAAIQSTKAGGKGLTNIAPSLALALDFFTGRPFMGSRIILLVSDGAAILEPETQESLRHLFNQNQVILYWIYLRTQNSASLSSKPKNPNERTTPEYFLHRFFQTMGTPYKAYEAGNPEAIKTAIADIGRLENQPIRYAKKIPRQDLSGHFYCAGLVLIVLLIIGKFFEANSWKA